ncbi:unnamed protein product [Rotaria sp. Silwood2]|nr:unnamed protein product [Rotaria sp. Silwood2]
MSRLRVVRCHSLLGFYNMQLKTPIALLNLQHLYLELNNLPFNQFNSLMTNISSTLQSLGICTTNDDHYINADNWITLISSHMCTLKDFYLHYSNFISNDEDYDAFHTTIRSFYSNFWTDRKWCFGYQHYSNQVEDGMDTETLVIFYSIKPYRNHNYDLFERASNLECHGDTGCNLSRCLTIHGHRSIINCEVKFQNVTSLIISDEHMDNDHWSIVNLIRIVPLEQLTKLIVECDSVCINTLFKILNDAKRIRSLELARYEISDIQFPFIKQVDNDNAIFNRNNIVQLAIRSVCTLQQLHLLLILIMNRS